MVSYLSQFLHPSQVSIFQYLWTSPKKIKTLGIPLCPPSPPHSPFLSLSGPLRIRRAPFFSSQDHKEGENDSDRAGWLGLRSERRKRGQALGQLVLGLPYLGWGCQEQGTEMECSGGWGFFGEPFILANEYSPAASVAPVCNLHHTSSAWPCRLGKGQKRLTRAFSSKVHEV